jgi:hypothetical protein
VSPLSRRALLAGLGASAAAAALPDAAEAKPRKPRRTHVKTFTDGVGLRDYSIIVGTPSWEAAVASRSFAQVEAWYAANTGHEALGIDYADLTAGSLESTSDGQVIEGIRGGPIHIAHNNVTVRGCRVESFGLHGAYFNPTAGASITGALIEHCTYDGGLADVRANFWHPANADAVTVRRCNIYGWRSGNTSYRGGDLEECWIHDLSAPDETHRTGCLIGGADCRYWRNYVTDGGSGCANIYFDINPVQTSSLEENILNGSSPNASPSYLINLKDGPEGPGATNVRIVGNYYGPEFQFGTFAGANVPWGSNGNEISGNVHFLTGDPA